MAYDPNDPNQRNVGQEIDPVTGLPIVADTSQEDPGQGNSFIRNLQAMLSANRGAASTFVDQLKGLYGGEAERLGPMIAGMDPSEAARWLQFFNMPTDQAGLEQWLQGTVGAQSREGYSGGASRLDAYIAGQAGGLGSEQARHQALLSSLGLVMNPEAPPAQAPPGNTGGGSGAGGPGGYDLPAYQPPPVWQPPAWTPPAYNPPPAYQPPAYTPPPAWQPPTYQPPTYQQPTSSPMGVSPPAYDSPTNSINGRIYDKSGQSFTTLPSWLYIGSDGYFHNMNATDPSQPWVAPTGYSDSGYQTTTSGGVPYYNNTGGIVYPDPITDVKDPWGIGSALASAWAAMGSTQPTTPYTQPIPSPSPTYYEPTYNPDYAPGGIYYVQPTLDESQYLLGSP